MKRIMLSLLIIILFLPSGCAEMIFDATENKKHGQTYEEYEKEQQKKETLWREHQKTYDYLW